MSKSVITLTALWELLLDSFDIARVLVIAPKRVAEDTWPAEIAKWDHLKGLTCSLVLGTEKQRRAALGKKAMLYIINRENVEWLVKHYAGRKLPFDMLVIDELSSFKNSRAKRFLALKKVLGQFTRVIGLTGTPAPNGLEDLWPQIYLLDRGARLGRTMRSYLDMYFDTPNSWLPYKRELKPGAEEAIYQRISDICVSMRAADHLKMPERVDNVVEISLSPREEKLYRQMERDMLLPYADGDVLALNAASLAGKLLQLANGAVYDEFHNVRVLHDRKLDALEDIIESMNGKPLLVAYWYQHDLDRIEERLRMKKIGFARLDSDASIAKWNQGELPVALIHPASAGHGLNLQSGGSALCWFGLTWSLELYQQTVARLYRQGQASQTVVVQHIITDGTIDERILKALQYKDRTQSALIDAVRANLRK